MLNKEETGISSAIEIEEKLQTWPISARSRNKKRAT